VLAALYRPSAVLWDGHTTWVLLEGYDVDVEAEARRLAQLGLRPCDGPPALPPERWVTTPAHALEFASQHRDAGAFVAELGVGIVHASTPQPPRPQPPGTERVQRRLREAFDPTRRLNPGRDPLAGR
jgi:hypothetical protein